LFDTTQDTPVSRKERRGKSRTGKYKNKVFVWEVKEGERGNVGKRKGNERLLEVKPGIR